MKFYAYRNICRNALEVVFADSRSGRYTTARPVQWVFEEREEGQCVEPTMVIPAGAAEALMQALWDAGLRPNSGAGSSAEADALRKHIAFSERVTDALLTKVGPPCS